MDYAGRIKKLRGRMEQVGVDAIWIANDASWEYFTGLPRGGRDHTKHRQNSLEYAGMLITQNSVTAFSPRLSAMGFSWHMEDYPQVDRLVLYPDVDIYGETFDREISAMGLDGKSLDLVNSAFVFSVANRKSGTIQNVNGDLVFDDGTPLVFFC